MNIVDWLKKEAELVALDRLLEAAAEIERLTAENEAIRKDRDDLLQQALGVEAERDIARMENERLRTALTGLRWKSADRDNMEFECRVTCYEKDAIDSVTQQQATKP